MGMIWASESAKANLLGFHRRNTAYRLTNIDPDSADYGASIVHTAVTAKRECGMDYETFYGMTEDGLDIMVKVENLGSAMELIAAEIQENRMTTLDKVLAIRAEQPNAHAAQIAQTIGVTSGRVYQILKELGLATTIQGVKGRPRQKTALWTSRKRKASNIRTRLESGRAYTEADGTTWWYVTALTPQWGQVIVSTWSGAVKTDERIYPNIDAALEAEV